MNIITHQSVRLTTIPIYYKLRKQEIISNKLTENKAQLHTFLTTAFSKRQSIHFSITLVDVCPIDTDLS